jgi:hypothetical protein
VPTETGSGGITKLMPKLFSAQELAGWTQGVSPCIGDCQAAAVTDDLGIRRAAKFVIRPPRRRILALRRPVELTSSGRKAILSLSSER